MISLISGNTVVKTARRAVECHLSGRALQPLSTTSPDLAARQGVFVSLVDRMNGGGLRGCIGAPLATRPLLEQVVTAAVEAATMDVRFRPIKLDELNKLIVEVTVLSPLEKLVVKSPLDMRDKILVGRDGLMIDSVDSRGLLLPQVAVEDGFDSEEFLSQCCMKAGLPPDAWLTGEVEVSSFQGQVFAEEKPNGRVFERLLGPRTRRGDFHSPTDL